MNSESLDKSHQQLLKKQVEEWRSQLNEADMNNVSWGMRMLNEKIARKIGANNDQVYMQSLIT